MKKFKHIILTAVIIGSVLTTATAAESFSVLLQKGIFAEETEGNLEAAIKIYERITAEAATNRSVVAQAQYRLGVCYQKKGNKEQAVSILNDLLKQFPAEAALSQKARELLVGLGQTPSSSITLRQLALTVEESIAVSMDGRFIACKPKENNNVIIHETATGKTWTAIKGNASQSEWNVVFSPDDRLIAYQLSNSNSVYIARLDGSDAKPVYQVNRDSQWIFDWSPDGGQLIVGSWEGGSTIIGALDVKTGTMKEIKRWPINSIILNAKASHFSNGRYLAYRVGWRSEERRRISLLDLESATETTLVEGDVGQLVGWFPGEAKILFLSNRTGSLGLWSITVREGKPAGDPELVKANMGDMSPLGLTRDGSLYYTETKSFKDVYVARVNFQTGEISGQPRRVSDRFLGEQSMPVWSKDGQKLMFAVQYGQTRFVAVPLAAGEPKEYPVWETFTTWLQQYAWSHDGTFLLATSGRKGVGHGIHRYELASGATETLVKTDNAQIPGRWICHPRFAPDGNSFYYLRRDFLKGDDERTDYKDSIIRRNLRSGVEEIVYASPDTLHIWWPYELSPDGERLALIASNAPKTNDFVVALKVRGVRGPETRELARFAPREDLNSLAWTPDGKRLVYTKGTMHRDQGANEPAGVWTIVVDTGQSVELKFSQPDVRDISLHPDGRQMAFRAGSSSVRNVWVMEGLMPKPVAQADRTTNK